jgi:dimethylamine/trimethylamine dehydrogenase
MTRDPRYDILFEPVRIGPVTAPNRFYQVPHCNGMGTHYPSAMAAMRGVKAEGGWGVVCTEECDFHHTGDITPAVEARLWSERDVPVMARMVEAVKRHGALAGCELVYGGAAAHNRLSREVPLAPGSMPAISFEPGQARAMSRQDIRAFRRWHRQAALRARDAGFDIVYVYAGHNLCLLQHFVSRRYNQRSDEYGGSIENRSRLLREVVEDTKEAVGDRMAVALRFAVEELAGPEGITADGDGRAVVELLADHPDLWDVNLSGWENDSQTARFAGEGFQEPFTHWVRQVTGRPVVGVGRYTSPDHMVSLIKKGMLDFIGAARPSIADPFLPRKIEQGRPEDIRECIGCNICVSGDFGHFPMRCTQNPTMGEEWRRGWHPERCDPKGSDDRVLIVGGGPAGLEAARVLGARGYGVTLAEAGDSFGGHVTDLARLPGLATWQRLIDYRLQQVQTLPNVEMYRQSRLDASQIIELAFEHVALATGSRWRRDGKGRRHPLGISVHPNAVCLTPDDVMRGAAVEGPVAIYDDDHYFMASVLAEKLRHDGLEVVYITPAPDAATWTHNTLEQERIQRRLIEIGVALELSSMINEVGESSIELACVYSGRARVLPCASVVLVTMRDPEDAVYGKLTREPARLERAGIKSLSRIGDCLAPGLLAAAVHCGHRYARELDAGPVSPDVTPFRRELVQPDGAGTDTN